MDSMTSLNPQGRNPLLIPDILQSILDFVEEHPKTLFALAQTCRPISEPSLDRLWRELQSLQPLIPIKRDDQDTKNEDVEQNDEDTDQNNQDTEKEDEDAEEDEDEWEDVEDEDDKDSEFDEVEELDPPTPAEWAVIEKYSHRVQKICVLKDSLSLGFLKGIGSQSLLFPNLRVLIWQPQSEHPPPGSLAWIYPLLSPTLVKLFARLTDADGETLRSFFQSYPHRCPNLKDVSFGFPCDQEPAQTATYELSRAVCSHDKLVDLFLHRAPIDDAAMRHLSLSPTIRKIWVEHTPQKPIPRPYFQPEDTPFRDARILQLTTSDLDFVTTLLGSRDQKLFTLYVQVHEQATAEALSAFFSMLASSSSYTESIRSLIFESNPSVPPAEESRAEEEPHVFRLSYQSLLPLMSFSHLRMLLLEWNDQISLDDDELITMARNWPSMESLKIRCKRGEYPPRSMKYITCQGLLRLIVACPKLRELCLPLDAREVPTDTDPDVRNTAIRRLCFDEPHLGDPFQVAGFIRKHFTSVSEVGATFSDPETNCGFWSVVDTMVKFG